MTGSAERPDLRKLLSLHLPAAPYRVRLENRPGEPFFRVDRADGARMLHLNMAHRFYREVYDGNLTTPDVRAALEVMLFSMGDVILEETADARAFGVAHVENWSRRLDLALETLASHMRSVDDREPDHGWLEPYAG